MNTIQKNYTLYKGQQVEFLRSIVVNYLERSFEQAGAAIAYIYCSYKEQEDQTAVKLIASLLQQLVQRKSAVSDEIASLYRCHIEEGTRPTLSKWSELLQLEVRRLSKVFIIVDALDECLESTRDSFLIEIRKLQPSIHLLVTSRHNIIIEPEFEKAARVEIRASDEDVKKYLKDRIESERQLVRQVRKDPALQETVINTIMENAKGM
jgi:NACHT domain